VTALAETALEPTLAPAVRRARADPVAKLLALADQAGVRFRWEGRILRVMGVAALHPEDQRLLRGYMPEIKVRLAASEDDADPCEGWGIEVRLVTDAAEAEAIIERLPLALGLDIETTARPGHAVAERPFLQITVKGALSKIQAKLEDAIGLDPLRSEPRTVQVFDPDARVAYVFDLRSVPIDSLAGLWERRLVIHNAAFELAALAAIGIRPANVFDSMQLVGLHLGCARGVRKLEHATLQVLSTTMPKAQQLSDWGADHLSLEQVRYAASDAAATLMVATEIWPRLGRPEHRCFKLSNAVVPIAAAMRIRGVGFSRPVHEDWITRKELALAEARRAFVEVTGEDVPRQGPQRRAWLQQCIPEDELACWPRTDAGYLSTKADDLARLADMPEIAALLQVDALDKVVRDFGRKLLDLIHPVTGRIHPHWIPCGAKTGRFTCADPNVQQMPKTERDAWQVDEGRLLVIADYGQIELRVAAELAQEDTMRAVFESGGDMHRINAAIFGRCTEEQVTTEQRSKAKATSFGTLFGQSARGLVQTAWNDWRIVLPLEEAQHMQAEFYGRYPKLRAWQRRNANEVRGSWGFLGTGLLRSICGRPLRNEWEKHGELKWTTCCNYPVQASAADLMLMAMVKVHRALERRDAFLVMQVHDELVIECAEAEAPAVVTLLEESMVTAWRELFPGGPTMGLIEMATRPCWATPPKE
jgi:DNA polymerase-1